MKKPRFGPWLLWRDRNNHIGIDRPGVYVVARSYKPLVGKTFSWCPEIIYVGMTNSLGGLRYRLQQFDNTIAGKTGHGGADRVRYKFRSYESLSKRLYVSVAAFECDVTAARAADLRMMGEVARLEYYCLADFVERFGCLPRFNDKKRSPKYSLSAKVERSPGGLNL